MSKPMKVYSPNAGDFAETLNHKILQCSNVTGNNNKFYSLELQKSPSNEFQLFSHYGRIEQNVISKGVYEIRSFGSSESEALKKFESILKTKKRGKTITKNGEKYKEQYLEIDLISSSVGSYNVRSKTKASSSKQVGEGVFDDFAEVEKAVLKMLEEENIHDITSNTSMTYSGGGLQTPLGPLTLSHLEKAKKVLEKINKNVKPDITKIPKKMTDLNNEYLSLIPRSFGNKISKDQMIITGDKVLSEFDLLNQMEAAIKITDIKAQEDEAKEKVSVGFEMKLASKEVTSEIIAQVQKSRVDSRGRSKHSNLDHYKVKRVFEIHNKKERINFEAEAKRLKEYKKENKIRKVNKLDYQEVDLFHGSRNSNILSILMNGIYIPPSNAAHVTSRMYGSGVYGADVVTKSLNYSRGGWGSGVRNRNRSIFCFIMRFALGKVHETGSALKTGTPAGFNSIFAKGGYDLQNNEYIVPKASQTTMSYLIEFEE